MGRVVRHDCNSRQLNPRTINRPRPSQIQQRGQILPRLSFFYKIYHYREIKSTSRKSRKAYFPQVRFSDGAYRPTWQYRVPIRQFDRYYYQRDCLVMPPRRPKYIFQLEWKAVLLSQHKQLCIVLCEWLAHHYQHL